MSTPSLTKEEQDRLTELGHHFENRKLIVVAQHDLRKTLDQGLLTISSAGLGLSLTVIKDMVPTQRGIEQAYWLVLTWGLFSLSILTTLAGIWLSWKAMQWKEKVTLSQYTFLLRRSEYPTEDLDKSRKSLSTFSARSEIAQAVAAIAFGCGIITVALFVFANL